MLRILLLLSALVLGAFAQLIIQPAVVSLIKFFMEGFLKYYFFA